MLTKVISDKGCTYQSARISARLDDPYLPEVYMFDDLYYLNLASTTFLNVFGSESVMIPAGYAMTFSSEIDFISGKK